MRVVRAATAIVVAVPLALVAGCKPDYSPNTYASSAVQQASKVQRGVVVGARLVDVAASGTVGAATGAAAGGAVGSTAGNGVTAALGAVGGALVGGLVGTGVEKTTGDVKAWEYIVRESGGDLVSVTQQDKDPLPLGQKVLVIAGSQARIVADYTTDPKEEPTIPPPSPLGIPAPQPEPPPAVAPAITETPLAPVVPAPGP